MARPRGERAARRVSLAIVLLIATIGALASVVLAGDTQRFDQGVLLSLRDPADLSRPLGPAWLVIAALDITALGSASVLGLLVASIAGFLMLQGQWRTGLFVAGATASAWVINEALKVWFQRPRPTVVPHLRDVVTMSFPSGHALVSAVVFLTLGVLLMRIAERPLVKWYCMTIAVALTLLVGVTRVYLGVHYPTDVLGGWLIGLTWALACWLIERQLERRFGLQAERARAS